MSGGLFFICIVVYIVIGYFVTKEITTSRDEFFGALMLLWPIILVGRVVQKIQDYYNVDYPFLKYLFVSVIIIAIGFLFLIYSNALFRY